MSGHGYVTASEGPSGTSSISRLEVRANSGASTAAPVSVNGLVRIVCALPQERTVSGSLSARLLGG